MNFIHQTLRFVRRSMCAFPQSVLIIANGPIPTAQFSFIRPLSARNIKTEFWSEGEIKTAAKQSRLLKQLRAFAPDVIVFCRYSGPHATKIVEAIRAAHIPIVFHIDDDLLNVPLLLGEKKHAFHNDPARIETVRYLLEHADLVYASNDRLAQQLKSISTVRAIASGAIVLASEVYREPALKPARRIGYMGFDHAADFALVSQALEAILERDHSLTFTMFGPVPIPAGLQRFGGRVRAIEPVRDYEAFRQRLADEAWDIGLCPLIVNHFNRLKSNIKWVEYTASGMASIASAGTVYDECCADGRGVLVDPGTQDWEGAISRLLGHDAERWQIARAAQDHLRAVYAPAALTQQVLEILNAARRIARR